MSRFIKLTRFSTKNANVHYISGFNLFVQAGMAIGMSDKVFIHQRSAPDTYTGEVCDEFVTIAGPVDMEEWPENDPDPSLPAAFFRKSTADVIVRSTAEAQILWEHMKKEVCILVDALNRLDELKLTEEFWCPGIPPEDSSESSDDPGGEIPGSSESSSESD